ncbi:MAG TPA: type II toxin-antitoxin system VapC family toxin [Candidatus Binatia bacterium]|nr:type II toxin-antitoxin system VapC family toxin [Candidatus Binatia bacterium]
MNLLLDTHIWIWSKLEPARIGKRAAHELSSGGNELWLSPVSVWEALTLMQKGRVRVSDPIAWVQRAADQMREAPLTQEIVRTSLTLSLSHADPADRFLAATAKVLKLTLVTADTRLLGLGEISTLANR